MLSHSFHSEIDTYVKKGKLPSFVAEIMRKFYQSYAHATLDNGYHIDELEPILLELLQLAVKQISHPYRFEPFHKKIVSPINYYEFGLKFIRPLIDQKRSRLEGESVLEKIEEQLKRKENVILLANHQIEPDPQVISILLEKNHLKLSQEMIFVAGHRVVTDPLAVPFSLGCNLLCIYSKKHIENPPELKAEKLTHNQKTMKKMRTLLQEGGKCIYVAPSGGRDRPDEKGVIVPAKFDPSSVEMFHLIAKQAKTPTHFYPFALSTYQILPPPNTVEKDIGEKRHAHFGPVFLKFLDEVDLDLMVDSITDKKEKRKKRGELLTELVRDAYNELTGLPT